MLYRDFPAPTPLPDGRNFGIGEAILIQAILCFGYCGLVIWGSEAGGAIETATRKWINISSTLTNAWIFAMPEHHSQAADAFDAPLHRHVVAASTFAPLVLFLALRGCRSQWSRATLAASRRSCDHGSQLELVCAGYYHMGLGVAAALITLIYGDSMFAGLGDWVFAQSWTFLRAPLLATLAFSFACYAAAFRWAA
jgi:hypothetical protein